MDLHEFKRAVRHESSIGGAVLRTVGFLPVLLLLIVGPFFALLPMMCLSCCCGLSLWTSAGVAAASAANIDVKSTTPSKVYDSIISYIPIISMVLSAVCAYFTGYLFVGSSIYALGYPQWMSAIYSVWSLVVITGSFFLMTSTWSGGARRKDL